MASTPSLPAPRDSSLPLSSTMEMRFGSRFGTEAAISCWIAWMFSRDSCAPGRSFRKTLAVAGFCWRANSSRLGSTRWTRACCTPFSVCTVRAISPSSARRWLMFCMKLVAPKPSPLSNSS